MRGILQERLFSLSCKRFQDLQVSVECVFSSTQQAKARRTLARRDAEGAELPVDSSLLTGNDAQH
jgi:hypothetical protein